MFKNERLMLERELELALMDSKDFEREGVHYPLLESRIKSLQLLVSEQEAWDLQDLLETNREANLIRTR